MFALPWDTQPQSFNYITKGVQHLLANFKITILKKKRRWLTELFSLFLIWFRNKYFKITAKLILELT